MDNQLNYQQARQIRNRSIKDLIADELIRGKGLGGAIGGAVGLRTQARIKGIKEKFDPLNIVKFLTFGSRLGPALYGKLFGRSRKDVEYFTGRASPIGERRKKITGIPGRGEGEDTSGMKVVLNQILTFLQKSHEKDMILREKENNLRESVKLDDEKRHRDLLKALANIGFDGETATKEKQGGGFLDGIMNFIRDIFDKLKGLADIIGLLKTSIVEIAKKVGVPLVKGLLSAGRWAVGTLMAPGVAAGGTVIAGSVAVAAAAKYLQDKQIEKAAERGDKKEVSKLLLEQAYPAETLFSLPPEDQIKAKEEVDKLADDVIQAAKERNAKSAPNDVKGSAEVVKGLDTGETATLVNESTPGTTSTSSSTEEGMKNYVPRFTSPPVVVEPPKSSSVNNAIQENVSLNLSTPTSAEKNQATQDKTNVVNQKSATGQKVPVPLVRNKEETFQRMIYNSLRLV